MNVRNYVIALLFATSLFYLKVGAQPMGSNCMAEVEVTIKNEPTVITFAMIALNPPPGPDMIIVPGTVGCIDVGSTLNYQVIDTMTNQLICFGQLMINDKCAFCDNSPVIVTTQSEVDNIPNLYVCDDLQIKRSLLIIEQPGVDPAERITDLSPLQGVTAIRGDFEIRNTTALTWLDGLEQLESVDGSLIIEGNLTFSDLTALSINSLESIGGDLIISNNPALENLDGLQSLTSVGGEIVITNNSNLTDCIPLLDLLSVTSSSDITISGNANGCESLEILLPTVPTLGQWCVIILFLLLLIIGVRALEAMTALNLQKFRV